MTRDRLAASRDLVRRAEQATHEHRFRTARLLHEEALRDFPEHSLFTAFNLGSLLQMYVGDGEAAREAYRRALDGRALAAGLARTEWLDEIEANVCENMMLVSLSFDEFETWAGRLAKLQPSNAALHDWRPALRELKEKGFPWWRGMQEMAGACYDADSANDLGRYGCAASIYQLLLRHRRELRLPKDEYQLVAIGYGAVVVTAWSRYGAAMESTTGGVDPAEINFIVEAALQLVEECAAALPSDRKLEATCVMMRQGLQATVVTATSAVTKPRQGGGRIASEILVAAGLGALLARLVFQDASVGLTLVLGAAVAAAIAWLRAVRGRDGRVHMAWRTSAELTSQASARGVSGLRFELVHAAVSPHKQLELAFRPLAPVPAGKDREAGYALRCVVALTLPHVVAASRRLELGIAGVEYRVMLGRGVPIPAYGVRCGSVVVGPLQAGSEEREGLWWVIVHPFVESLEQRPAQEAVFSELAREFLGLQTQSVVLP